MTGQDISWSTPEETFNLRVAAVIEHGHKVLLCTVDGLGYWFLPGGRVRFGESAQRALSRELAEELGHQFPAGRLALVVENIYRDGSLQHEVGFYYRLAWPAGIADSDLGGGTEPGHSFRWAAARVERPCAHAVIRKWRGRLRRRGCLRRSVQASGARYPVRRAGQR